MKNLLQCIYEEIFLNHITYLGGICYMKDLLHIIKRFIKRYFYTISAEQLVDLANTYDGISVRKNQRPYIYTEGVYKEIDCRRLNGKTVLKAMNLLDVERNSLGSVEQEDGHMRYLSVYDSLFIRKFCKR